MKNRTTVVQNEDILQCKASNEIEFKALDYARPSTPLIGNIQVCYPLKYCLSFFQFSRLIDSWKYRTNADLFHLHAVVVHTVTILPLLPEQRTETVLAFLRSTLDFCPVSTKAAVSFIVRNLLGKALSYNLGAPDVSLKLPTNFCWPGKKLLPSFRPFLVATMQLIFSPRWNRKTWWITFFGFHFQSFASRKPSFLFWCLWRLLLTSLLVDLFNRKYLFPVKNLQ